jgi:hypothetical protein
MERLHVIRIETQGDSGRLMVNIYSDYFGQKISIPLDNEPGDITPAITTAQKKLESMGFSFVGYSAGKNGIHYLITDCWFSIQPAF